MKMTKNHSKSAKTTVALRNLRGMMKAINDGEKKYRMMTKSEREKENTRTHRYFRKQHQRAFVKALNAVPASAALQVAECFEAALEIIEHEVFELRMRDDVMATLGA